MIAVNNEIDALSPLCSRFQEASHVWSIRIFPCDVHQIERRLRAAGSPFDALLERAHDGSTGAELRLRNLIAKAFIRYRFLPAQGDRLPARRRGDRLARGARTATERRRLARPKTMPTPAATATAASALALALSSSSSKIVRARAAGQEGGAPYGIGVSVLRQDGDALVNQATPNSWELLLPYSGYPGFKVWAGAQADIVAVLAMALDLMRQGRRAKLAARLSRSTTPTNAGAGGCSLAISRIGRQRPHPHGHTKKLRLMHKSGSPDPCQ